MMTQTTISQVLKVREENYSKFQDYIEKLNKVAKKLGIPAISVKPLYIIEEHVRGTKDGVRIIFLKRFRVVEISGTNPMLAGYTFKARLEFDHGKKHPMVHCVPGQEIPHSFTTTDHHCDHCASNRFRGKVYVVQHESGDYKQVGSSCIKDFLGHGNIEETLKFLAAFDLNRVAAFSEYDDEARMGSIKPWLIPIEKEKMLLGMIKLIDRYGYVSRKMVEGTEKYSTSDLFSFCLWYRKTSEEKTPEMVNVFHQPATDEQKAKVAEMLNQIKGIVPASTYEHNIVNLANADFFLMKDAGLVASMFPFLHAKNEKKEEKKEVPVSEYVGMTGQRIEITLTVNKIIQMPDNGWGTSWLYSCADKSGNVFTFYTTKKDLANEEETVKVKGTIKEHKLYREVKQTVMNRVKVL